MGAGHPLAGRGPSLSSTPLFCALCGKTVLSSYLHLPTGIFGPVGLVVGSCGAGLAIVAAEVAIEIVGDRGNFRAESESSEPGDRDRRFAMQRAKDVAGDRAGAIAVTAVIHGEDDPGGEILGFERAEQDDRQGLLRDPALPESRDRLGRGRSFA